MVDEEPTGGSDEAADVAADRAEQQAEDEIVGLAWDDELPVALGEEVGDEVPDSGPGGEDGEPGTPAADAARGDHAGEAGEGRLDGAPASAGPGEDVGEDSGEDMGELYDDHVGGRRNALPRRVESWRSRSATGAIATAIAMGLQQVFEPERRRPAAVAEAPSDPYDDDDPITVDYLPDDAEGTTVHVKPWLLQKGEPG